jgi:O-antigen/teichoic acid export membrane protein
MMIQAKSKLDLIKRFFLEHNFFRNVTILAGGTALAQGILLIATPIITRVYSPEQYGIYGAYLSVLSIILVVASLRYELAISLPEKDDTAANLMGLSLIIVAIVGIVTVVIIKLFWPTILKWIQVPALKEYIWLLPVSVLGAGSYQVISFWSVRKKTFDVLAKTKLRQSIGKALSQLGLGFTGFGVFGLLIGQLIGDTAGCGTLLSDAIKRNKHDLKKISFVGICSVARKYWRFPVYATPSKMLSVATVQMPMLFIIAYFGAEKAGWFALAQLVLGAPVSFIIVSVFNVFWSEASQLAKDNPKKLRELFFRVVRTLLFVCLPMAIIIVFSPTIFPIVFGQQWTGAGILARNLGLMYITQFIIMPISILSIFELQHWETAWNLLCCIGTIACFAIGNHFCWELNQTVLLLGNFLGLANILLFYLNIKAINKNINNFQYLREEYDGKHNI